MTNPLIELAERPDAWLDEPDQCRPCHGPIVAKTKLGMIRDYVCYVLMMHWPYRFFMSRPHAAILPYAGNHAFSCTCWHKIASLRAIAQGHNDNA